MKIYLVFLLGILAWSISLNLLKETANFYLNNLVLIGGLMSAFSISAFLNRKIFNIKNLLLILFLSLFSILNLIIQDISIVDKVIVPVRGPAYPLYALTILFFIIHSIKDTYNLFKRADPVQRNKLFYFVLGISIMIFVSLFSNLILPWLGINKFQLLGPISVIIFLIFSCYAILVKKLVDVKIVLQRSIIYIIIFGLVTTSYLLILNVIFGHITNSKPHLLASIFVIFVSIKTIPLIDKWLRKKTDPWLFGEKVDGHVLLKRISKSIIDIQNLEELITLLSKELKFYFRVKEVSLNIADKYISPIPFEYVFTQNNKKMYIPILDRNNLLSTIHLGYKKSGESFSYQDVCLLSLLSYQVSAKLKQVQLISELKLHSKYLKESLDESEEEKEKMSKNQNRMITDIAHNLQTPLTILKGELDNLEKMNNLFENKDLRNFNKSVDRLSQFITRLLQAADIREDTLSLKKINISDYLSEMCEYFEVIADSQKVSFDVHIEDDIHANIDVKYLRDAIANIVSNAFKYKKSSKHKVSFSLTRKQTSLSICISDNGIGIEKEQLPHVFTRWYQADNNKKGSGLGLAIASNIIQKHSGSIAITSEKDQGTSVIITLPIAK